MPYVCTTMKSPVGTLKLVAGETSLAAVLWENDDPRRVPWACDAQEGHHSVLADARDQLEAYFAGTRRAFSLPLEFTGTDFQKQVWTALLAIPFGETRSYGGLADAICNPGAVRAVGAANGGNPLSIIVPCHRVIGATGRLTGFAGGLSAKQFLLTLESRKAPSLWSAA